MKSSAKPRNLLLILFGISAGFAVLFGGQISVVVMPVSPGGFWSSLSGGELAELAQALGVIPAVVALCVALVRTRVVPMPRASIALGMVIFFTLLLLSLLVSRFRYVSFQSWLDWALYGVAFFGAVILSGRVHGPRLILQFIVGAGALVALKGIGEYASMRAVDPSWRIFADWNNANALAGMLLLVVFPALGLMLTSERLERLFSGLAATLVLFALALTQSKGGFLAAGAGVLVWLVAAVAWGGWKRASVSLLPFLVAGVMVFALQAQSASAGPMQRVATRAENSEQSGRFRKLLWQTSIDLIQAAPLGTGLNTFQFESGSPGRVTPTYMAHQSYLQLAAEAGIVTLVLFLGIGVLWLREMLRGARKLPPDRSLLRAGILAAVAASAAHSLVDSDWYYFGCGFIFFLLLGLGLQLSNDATSPELAPRSMRWVLMTSVAAVGTLSLLFGWHEAQKSLILGRLPDLAAFEEMKELPDGGDGEWVYLQATWSRRMGMQSDLEYQRAAQLAPSLRHLRAWARVQIERREFPGAESTLRSALKNDPNNLATLAALLELYQAQQSTAQIQETAQRMIEVEKTSTYQVRSLPELIPTETAWARGVLAEFESDRSRRAQLLQEALEIYQRYHKVTVPRILQATRAGLEGGFAGESLEDARQNLRQGQMIASRLAETYRELEAPSRAAEAEAAGRELAIDESSTSTP
ncbi:MAG TPA: O-antigen ligase family protein [Fimbriimonadaceae bacterium]|nr:O-antigen ligase family protein [Fimbriimonadaceae bacterium]HRJ33081.1 O-antigen ligase family protein [Fimbriimonadaceae bacterium]